MGKSRKGMVKAWRTPRNAEELAKTLFLFMDDALGLIGSCGRNKHGGDIGVESPHFYAKVIIDDEERDDGLVWRRINAVDYQGYQKWKAEVDKWKDAVAEMAKGGA